jgi:hypothetical protein
MHTLQKPSSPTNCRAIFRINICINSIVPAIDAAMAPNSPTTLRAHLSPCPPSRLRGTKPPRCNIVDTESDTSLHLRATSSQGLLQKMMPPVGRAASCVAIVQSGRPGSGVSPGATPSLAGVCSKNDAHRGNNAERRHHSIWKPRI